MRNDDLKEKFQFFKKPELISRTPKVKQRFARKINLKPLGGFFYLIVLAGIAYFILFSGRFNITKVEIEGVKSLEISDHITRSLTGRNILFLQTGSYLHSLTKKFPILQEAKIIRGLPSTIKISILERNQILIWCNANECYEVDNNGYPYQKIPRPTDRVVVYDETNLKVSENQIIVSPQFIDFFLKAIDQLNQQGIKIKEGRIAETTFKVTFLTESGWRAIFDTSESLQNQISALKQVIETNGSDIHEYVDVRVKGLAYIK